MAFLCRKCKGKGFYIQTDGYGEEYAVKCDCKKREQLDFRLNQMFEKSNLPNTSRNYSFDSYNGKDNDQNINKLKKYVSEFSDKYKNYHLYFYSEKGSTQKTTMASCVGYELLKKGFSVYFVIMDDLVKLLTTQKEEDLLQLDMGYILDCDLVIIDDSFRKDKVTIYKSGYQIPFLDSFLRNRLEISRKATIFTSNAKIEDIENEGFGKSIQDLVERNVTLLNFNDHVSGVLKSIWD